MDGAQGKLNSSLQFRLSLGLSLAILAVAVVGGSASFILAFNEAIELQDDQLRQMAAIARHRASPPVGETAPDADIEARVVVQVLSRIDAGASDRFPPTLRDGLQTITQRQVTWRVFVTPVGEGERIAVAQRTALRDEIARDSALRTLTPFLLLMPILLLLVRVLIRRMFAPLRAIASDLDQRRDDGVQPITDPKVPAEIRPFVVAIDRLLARVAQSMAIQRRFVADAAHELRSPMTALSLQAEQLAAVDMSEPGRERLAALRGGIQRTRELLDQLLALARAQAPSQADAGVLSLRQAVRDVLEDLMPLAESKSLDVGVEGAGDARVRADSVDLKTLVKNLIENAIRYSPAGGRIDLHIEALDGVGRLQVDDSGPGIAEMERTRVFDPFYRVVGARATGSGLGLSIVKAVADRLHATIELGWVDEQRQQGLRVTVAFPTA